MPVRDNNKQRHILFIVLPYLIRNVDAKDSKTRSFTAFPYGVLSVATYLKNHAAGNVDMKVIDCNTYDDEAYLPIIEQHLDDFNPDLVGFAMQFDNSYKHLETLSKMVKKKKKEAVVVLGGAAASYSYEAIANEQDNIDGICYLEGEIPFLKLIDSENMLECLNNDDAWITRRSLKEGRTPQPVFIQNLDEVVAIDYSFISINNYEMKEAFSPFTTEGLKEKKQFFLVTSRGCPYKCVFCSNAAIHGRKVRYSSVDAVIAHVKYLISNFGMNVLTIYDEQLLGNKARAKEIFRQLAKFNLRIECPNGLSVAFIDEEMAALMRNAGMDTVALAIESGSRYVLNKVIHKPLKLEMVKPVVQSLRKYGFFIQGFFVSGLPGENEAHRAETLSFIKDVELDWSGFSLATPLRGSELYEICVKNGYISKDLKIGEIEDKKYILKIPGVSPEEVTRETYLMNLDVNFVNNYRMKVGDYAVAANCFQDVIARYGNHAFAYYYLAKAQAAKGEDHERLRRIRNKFHEIIRADKTWRGYAEYFKLEFADNK